MGMAQQFLEVLPHYRELGMKLYSVGQGRAVISLPYDERLIGDPDSGVIHGGAVSALMDTCGGTAVMAHPRAGKATATLSLRIDYLRTARPGEAIEARAECFQMTHHVAFVRATAHDETGEGPVATATGSFTVEHAA